MEDIAGELQEAFERELKAMEDRVNKRLDSRTDPRAEIAFYVMSTLLDAALFVTILVLSDAGFTWICKVLRQRVQPIEH